MKIDLLNNELPFFIFLALFIRFGIGPSNHVLAALTIDVTHTVQAGNENAIFGWPHTDIDTIVKQIRTPYRRNEKEICVRSGTI